MSGRPVLYLPLAAVFLWEQHAPGGCRCVCSLYHGGSDIICLDPAEPGLLLRIVARAAALSGETAMSDPLTLCSKCYAAIESHSPHRPPASEQGMSAWSDEQFANLAVIGEAERVAAGERRLTIRHGLPADGYAVRDELYAFVAAVCSQHQIRSLNMIASGGQAADEISWTRWHFDPPSAAADLAIVRAALQTRYPAWPIEAEDD